ncbi:hypothetical protein IWQ60_007405, partial [Tieghemiomyces parasiticus]
MYKTLGKDLGFHSHFNCRVTHSFTNDQHYQRVCFATEFLEEFDGVSDYLLDSIVPVNETR